LSSKFFKCPENSPQPKKRTNNRKEGGKPYSTKILMKKEVASAITNDFKWIIFK
jgi:hypothetical protein